MLTSQKRERLKEIAKTYNLKLVLIFGSAARERVHPGSDIDVAVLAADYESFSLTMQSDLHLEIQRLFEDREVDLVFLNRADPLFMKKILENYILLYGSKQLLAKLRIYAYKRYVDHKKYFDLERDYAERFIRKKLKGKSS